VRGLTTAALDANGRACILPMKKNLSSGAWVTDRPGWGLLDAETRDLVDPAALVTGEKIEMTRWEVHDIAIQVVCDYLKEQGFQLKSWQGDPELNPSIWFVGRTKRPEWVVVRSTKFPASSTERPSNWEAIAKSCAKLSTNGNFASVIVASVDQPFASRTEEAVPLWRGYSPYPTFCPPLPCRA
jgi:hypothetical protein